MFRSALVGLLWVVAAKAGPWYVAKASTEAVLNFDATVQLFAPRSTPDKNLILQAIESQVQHLFGSMAAADTPAVPKADHQITNVRLEPSPEKDGLYNIHYHYVGTAVVHNGPRTHYDILLPIRPSVVYQQSLVKIQGRYYNPCTDPHYQAEEDFFYFWDPFKKGCPLKEGEHFTRIRGAIERLPNSRLTYPDYPRLIQNGRIRIDLLIGMDEPHRSTDFRRSYDLNAYTARAIREILLAQGYTEQILSPSEVTQLLGQQVRPVPSIAAYRREGKRAGIDIRLFFGPSGLDELSHGFHIALKDALARSSVLLYDGHSGLGGHLDLQEIEARRGYRLTPNANRYQIYYFNACTTYPYYQRDYFGRKRTSADPRGTYNLDILTNGLAAGFEHGAQADLALVLAIQKWADGGRATSYQRLAELLEADTLFGANGDEDNPTTEPR